MPEYYENRCCMCPNAGNAKTECPTGPLKYAVTPCRFVKTYRDEWGWMYKVMSGIGDDTFKARYQKPEKGGWKGVPKLPWQESFDRAQSDLNAFAKQRGWEELICDEEPTGPCADCFFADWIDLYGRTIWGCDMQYCRLAAEEEEL